MGGPGLCRRDFRRAELLSNLTAGRLDPGYADIVRQIATFAHGKSGAPVWLVGTSRGTVAAANGAATSPAPRSPGWC